MCGVKKTEKTDDNVLASWCEQTRTNRNNLVFNITNDVHSMQTTSKSRKYSPTFTDKNVSKHSPEIFATCTCGDIK